MWVRSQDKKHLVDCIGFYVYEKNVNAWDISDGGDEALTIGTYFSEEEAIEVLDLLGITLERYSSKVFYMPKARFTEKREPELFDPDVPF